ncbi:MAG: 2-dehydropantoate 2-reductase [Oscillospiraceae bacterium]|nr:2-dehydropantoate 2-reductase [Oscillospiraceae bacterium]
MDKIKKVSLIGLGGVGGMFAAQLAPVLGDNFRVIAGSGRKARFENEFLINDKGYRFQVADPNEVGDPADLVIITVKSYALEAAIADIQNQVGPNTLILNFLNGVLAEERLIAAFGESRVLYGYTYVVAALKENGSVGYLPGSVRVRFGEKVNEDGNYTPRVSRVCELFDKAGINYRVERDLMRGMWKKFLMNIGENMPMAALRLTYAGFRSEHYREISRAGKAEVVAIAQAKGIDLRPEDNTKHDLESIETYKKIAGWQPSTCTDLDAGKTTEVDLFAGAVVQMGRELGIPTPYNQLYYHAIKVMEEKNQGLFAVDS